MSTTISGTNGVTFPDSTSMQTGQQACKAWVNFNGSGTVAIRAAYNVYGITDNGTGDFTINFTTAMPDANYMGCGSAGNYNENVAAPTATSYRPANKTTSTHRFSINYATANLSNYTDINVAVFR